MFVIKLLLGSGEMEVCSVEPDLISDLVFDGGFFLFVVLDFHLFCCFSESGFCLIMDKFHGSLELFGCGGAEWGMRMRVGRNTRVSSVIDEEGAFTGGGVYPIIVLECCQRQPFGPVSLPMINEYPKVFLDFLIGAFCLSVSLWVKCR